MTITVQKTASQTYIIKVQIKKEDYEKKVNDTASKKSVANNELEELLNEKESKVKQESKRNRWQLTSNVATIFLGSITSYPDQVFNLLQEIHRTMKSQAWLRITVPDLQKYVDYYERRIVNPVFSRWPTGCEAIHSLTQNHRHLSVWDEQLLARFLKNAGFINIQKVAFQEGNDRRICLDQAVRQYETLYMEAQKP
jgi:hypothetical protein